MNHLEKHRDRCCREAPLTRPLHTSTFYRVTRRFIEGYVRIPTMLKMNTNYAKK